ncbi:MAG: hypothetical protein AAF797_00505 [Planctomycetota bacterium]
MLPRPFQTLSKPTRKLSAVAFLSAVLLIDIGLHLAFFAVIDQGLPYTRHSGGAVAAISGAAQVLMSTAGLIACLVALRHVKSWVTVLVIVRLMSLCPIAGFAIGSQENHTILLVLMGWSLLYILLLIVGTHAVPDRDRKASAAEVSTWTHSVEHTHTSCTDMHAMLEGLESLGIDRSDTAVNLEVTKTQDDRGTVYTVHDKQTGVTQVFRRAEDLPPQLRRWFS